MSQPDAQPAVSVAGLTPFLLAMTLCAPLWGMNVAQADTYYRTYKNDRKLLKWLVGTCVFLNTAQLGVLAYTLYFWLITCRIPENYILLGSLKRSMAPSYLTYFLTTVVQSFYAMRVFYVSGKNKFLTLAILFLSFTQMVTGFALCTHMLIVGTIQEVYSDFNHVSGGIELSSSMLCDIIISSSLVFYLRGRLQGFKSTRAAVNKLILYSVNIGIVTNIFALTNLVTWLAAPEEDFTWAVFHFSLGKIYVNSMLVSLNAREGIRKQMRTSLHVYPTTGFDVDAVSAPQFEVGLTERNTRNGTRSEDDI